MHNKLSSNSGPPAVDNPLNYKPSLLTVSGVLESRLSESYVSAR
jgi:hypothetical protein